jgi:hypothetical protein
MSQRKHSHPESVGKASQTMRILVIAILLLMAGSCAQTQAQTPKADSRKQGKDQKSNKADETADKILAETKELQVVSKWYEQIYPALKRKYKKPVSHPLYDTWRELYFEDEVAPLMVQRGYGYASAREAFMKQTEKQPSN